MSSSSWVNKQFEISIEFYFKNNMNKKLSFYFAKYN